MLALIFFALTAIGPQTKQTSYFTQALDQAYEEQQIAEAAFDRAHVAWDAHDIPTMCMETRNAYQHTSNMKVIFQKTLVFYQQNIPDSQQIQGYLKQDIDSASNSRLPFEVLLIARCGGVEAK